MDLKKILAEHAKWLTDPKTGARADLRGADLRGANYTDGWKIVRA